MFDDINLSERERGGDATILDLFHRWQAAMLPPAGWPEAEDASEENLGAVIKLEDQIRSTPSSGAVGLAIKCYMLAHDRLGGKRENACALAAFTEDSYGAPGRWLYDADRTVKSLIEDAARLVLELAPLAAEMVAAPLSLSQQKAEDASLETGSDDPAVEIAGRIALASARADQANAEHNRISAESTSTASEIEASREAADAAVRALSDIEDELASVTATTLPGIEAQLEYLTRLSHGYSGLRVRLCRNSLAMISGVKAGVRELDAETMLSQLHSIEATFAVDEIDGELLAPEIEGLPELTCRRLIAGVAMIQLKAGEAGL